VQPTVTLSSSAVSPDATPAGPSYTIVLAASEVVGFAKTGGLADVAGALPRALAQRGHRCFIFLPLYRSARTGKIPLEPTDIAFEIPVGARRVLGRLARATLPDSTVTVYLVDQPEYYDRDDKALGRGLYQYSSSYGQKRDYPDNCQRFVFFCRAVLESLHLLDLWPDVIHANDWQTGLLPVYLEEIYKHLPDESRREKYRRIQTLFTIHNIAYQGLFPSGDMPLTGLDWKLFNYLQLEFYDQINFLKGGIVFSSLINTVSPTYAREIQTPYYGWSLNPVLYERRDRLFGIVNGVDYGEWDPARDPRLKENYDPDHIEPGKAACKHALQERLGLPREQRAPLLGVVARLVEQKGIDLILEAAPGLLEQGCQLAVLGEGDPVFHTRLQELKIRFPDHVGLLLGFDETLAHQIEAGADIFLMPSKYEPSGLNQLYSLKYGTPPVVRVTGGLADTVTDTTTATLSAGTATGFGFGPPHAEAFRHAVQRAIDLSLERPDLWRQLQQTGMRQDWSWNRSAAEYEKLYARLRTRR
jgi:starch synthase